MSFVRVTSLRAGRGGQVYFGQRRFHHGMFGLMLLAGSGWMRGRMGYAVALAGVAMMWDDRADAGRWLLFV